MRALFLQKTKEQHPTENKGLRRKANRMIEPIRLSNFAIIAPLHSDKFLRLISPGKANSGLVGNAEVSLKTVLRGEKTTLPCKWVFAEGKKEKTVVFHVL